MKGRVVVQVICDICGKEIKKPDRVAGYSVGWNKYWRVDMREFLKFDGYTDSHEYDICPLCMERIKIVLRKGGIIG